MSFKTIKDFLKTVLIQLKKMVNILAKGFLNLYKFLIKGINFLNKKFQPFYFNLKKWEKMTIISMLIVVVVCTSLIINRKYISRTKLIPSYGGTYTEGIVANNTTEIDQVIKKLTDFGLTYFDNDHKLQPGLAERWNISSDGKTYTFYLRNGIDATKIIDSIRSYKNGWNDIDIKNPDNKTIQFILKQPYSPFLVSTTQPMFEYGPYKLVSQDKQQIVFKANDDFFAGKPYIDKIVLKLYPDQGNIDKALLKDKLMGLAGVDDSWTKTGFTNFQMSLPRYTLAFFNLNRDLFKDDGTRQKIKNGQKLDKEIHATLSTQDKEDDLQLAQDLKDKWDAIGLKVDIISYDSITLQKDIIPSRNYDILLYGIDYGYDPDPYPFWHTSQMLGNGLNLSNFSDQKADALLEEARQTNDETVRQDKYQKFQQIFDDKVPAIVLNQAVFKFSISQKVTGLSQHNGITNADRFNEIWEWYINTKRVKK